MRVSSHPVENIEKLLRIEVESLRKLVRSQQQTIEELEQQLKKQQERIKQLEEELRERKKLKGKPKIAASRLNEPEENGKGEGKRPGSQKRSKKQGFQIDQVRVIQPDKVPEHAKFNGYREYDIQELEIHRCNIRFRLAEYVQEDGSTIVGQLPPEYRGNGHYGPLLVGHILYQHYQCRVPQPLLCEQLQEWGIEISTGQLNRILTENKQVFECEQEQVLRVGLESAIYVQTDDTGARHDGKNGYCTVIGNEFFAYFKSTQSKSRRNFLEVLQGSSPLYVLNDYAQSYLELHPLAAKHLNQLTFGSTVLAQEQSEWQSYLKSLGIETPKAVRLTTEAALLGGLIEQGISEQLRILSDGAGQFNLFVHALCWVHAERALRRLQGNTAKQRQNIEQMQQRLWDYYQQLKAYQQNPSPEEKARLLQQFELVFGRCYLHHPCLNNVLTQFREHKAELLQVLDCPQVPLHNNASESDIREYVTRRKISGCTRSEAGRRARDTFVGLKKTCRKLGISFWQYLMSRLRGDGLIPPLPDVIRKMALEARQVASTA